MLVWASWLLSGAGLAVFAPQAPVQLIFAACSPPCVPLLFCVLLLLCDARLGLLSSVERRVGCFRSAGPGSADLCRLLSALRPASLLRPFVALGCSSGPPGCCLGPDWLFSLRRPRFS